MNSSKPQHDRPKAGVLRYAVASGFALLLTALLLILMTRLIMPLESDQVVATQPLELEFSPTIIPREEDPMRLFERPDRPDPVEIPEIYIGEAREPIPLEELQDLDESDADPAEPPSAIDLRARARSIIQDREDEKYQAWLAEQSGQQRYVSIMQGPIPRSDTPRASAEQGGGTGSHYRSVYGETEVTLGDNCVMQLRSTTFDYSDFASKLPAMIRCRAPRPKMDLSGLNRRVAPPGLAPAEEPVE